MAQEDGRILGTRPREEGKGEDGQSRLPEAPPLTGSLEMFRGGQSGAAGKTKLRERC